MEISAVDLSDAIEKSKELLETDFVSFGDSSYLDGEMVIRGVYNPEQTFKG